MDRVDGRFVAGRIEPVIAQPPIPHPPVGIEEETGASRPTGDPEGAVGDPEGVGQFEVGVGKEREVQPEVVDEAPVEAGARLAGADHLDVFAAGEPVEIAERTPLVDAVGAEVDGVEAEQHRTVVGERPQRRLLDGPVRTDEHRADVRGRLPHCDRLFPCHRAAFGRG
ncbi:hypothetical protein GCM10027355_32010 [Haloplanus salinarum]